MYFSIASVAFGFNNDSINQPDNVFRSMGSKVFKPNFRNMLRALITFLMPQMAIVFGIKAADADVEEFMYTIVKETITFREKNNWRRNDFMQVSSLKLI